MIIYLNNILIFIQTLEDYHKIVYRILEVLTKYLHSEKYKFNGQRVEYIRLVISEDQMEINFIKVASIYD